MRCKKYLLLIIAIALLLRLAPVALYGMPISYDAPFHMRMSSIIADSGQVPEIDTSLGSRPNNYPPFYHVLLAELSLLTGLGIGTLAMFVLPFFSALVALSVFVFVRAVSGDRNAVIASFLVAVASPLIAAAYDSPENFVFFFLPLVLLMLHRRRERGAAFLYVSALFWNYFVVIMSAVPMLAAYGKRGGFVKAVGAGVLLFFAYDFFVGGASLLSNRSLESAMFFVSFNLRNSLPVLAIAAMGFFIPAAWLMARNNHEKKPEMVFAFWWGLLSAAAAVSFLVTPLLRPWEHLKFLAIAGIIGICSVRFCGKTRNLNRFVVFLAAFMLLSSVLISLQVMYPRLNKPDLRAVAFLAARAAGTEGTVLAEPSLSEYIRLNSGLGSRLLTSLYFENARKDSFLGESLEYLARKQGSGEEAEFVQSSRLKFIITNFEDSAVRGTEWLGGKDYINKIYSLGYRQNCPFWFLPKEAGYACGELEAEVFEVKG